MRNDPQPHDISEDEFRVLQTAIQMVNGLFGIWYLSRLYELFDGDLLSARILGEIAHHNIAALAASGDLALDDPDRYAERLYGDGRLLPCNAYSIATACGVPRETVRRKIDDLVNRGWLMRNEQKEVFLTSAPSEHFASFNRELANQILAAASQLRAVLDRHQGRT